MSTAIPSPVAVIIPAYNEAATIANIVHRASRFSGLVIVVNDGSWDSTARVLEKSAAVILSNPTNLGKGESLLRGARFALEQGAAYIITLDGDGQHRPEDIQLLLDKSGENPDAIIIAARLHNRFRAPPLRRFANGIADFWISWAAGYRIRDSQSGFRLYPAAVFRQCRTAGNNFVFESEILIDAARQGIFSQSAPVDTIYHKNARRSHYRPASDTWAIVKMVGMKLIMGGLYPLGLLRSLGIWPQPVSKQSTM